MLTQDVVPSQQLAQGAAVSVMPTHDVVPAQDATVSLTPAHIVITASNTGCGSFYYVPDGVHCHTFGHGNMIILLYQIFISLVSDMYMVICNFI